MTFEMTVKGVTQTDKDIFKVLLSGNTGSLKGSLTLECMDYKEINTLVPLKLGQTIEIRIQKTNTVTLEDFGEN